MSRFNSRFNHPLPAANLLADAQSLYLRRHAHDPVHWRRWGEAALAEGKAKKRPILVSSGYAACHWCHVMARESFSDPEIADIMNRNYVAIKLDREERPEIDGLLMEALHALGQPGGWPLTCFLTPEGRVFWGGTYFPRPAFRQLLLGIAAMMHRDAGAVEAQQRSLRETMARAAAEQEKGGGGAAEIAPVLALMDGGRGGVKGRIKFPVWPLGEYFSLAGDCGHSAARAAAEQLQRAICTGGLCDQIGGGFFRYATDAHWRWPHFEKMLYDNGLAMGWLAQYPLIPLAQSKLRMTGEFLLREMQLPEGGFAASLDADQKAGEGAYYLWRRQEVAALLGHKEADFFFRFYPLHVEEEGAGGLPFHHAQPDNAQEAERLAQLVAQLAHARARRPRPARDEKLLADANGLALEGLARAGMVLGEEAFLAAALEGWEKVLLKLRRGEALLHCAYHGTGEPSPMPAIADDYAFMISAALALFEASGRRDFFEEAGLLAEKFDRDFWDEKEGGYFYASPAAAGLEAAFCARRKHAQDGPCPSANGRMIANCARLAAGSKGRAAAHWQARGEALWRLFAPGGVFYGAGVRAGHLLASRLVRLAGDVGAVDAAEKQRLRTGAFPGLFLTHAVEPGQKPGSFILCRGDHCLAPAQGAAALGARLAQAAGSLQTGLPAGHK